MTTDSGWTPCQCGEPATENIVTFAGSFVIEVCHTCAVRQCDPLLGCACDITSRRTA